MKTLIVVSGAIAALSLGTTLALAATLGGDVQGIKTLAEPVLQQIDWRHHRHCWWKHGHKHCD
jgi:hypothetical protein